MRSGSIPSSEVVPAARLDILPHHMHLNTELLVGYPTPPFIMTSEDREA